MEKKEKKKEKRGKHFPQLEKEIYMPDLINTQPPPDNYLLRRRASRECPYRDISPATPRFEQPAKGVKSRLRHSVHLSGETIQPEQKTRSGSMIEGRIQS